MKHETINFTLIIKLQNSEIPITSIKTLSTWGVIRGFDRAVAEMNCTFSNML